MLTQSHQASVALLLLLNFTFSPLRTLRHIFFVQNSPHGSHSTWIMRTPNHRQLILLWCNVGLICCYGKRRCKRRLIIGNLFCFDVIWVWYVVTLKGDVSWRLLHDRQSTWREIRIPVSVLLSWLFLFQVFQLFLRVHHLKPRGYSLRVDKGFEEFRIQKIREFLVQSTSVKLIFHRVQKYS